MNKSVLENVKTLLGIANEKWDDVINTHILLLTQEILNYCNIDELPKKLNPVLVKLIVSHMKVGTDEFITVSSTKFGDTSVSYNTEPINPSILDDVTSQLNKCRKMRW